MSSKKMVDTLEASIRIKILPCMLRLQAEGYTHCVQGPREITHY